MKRNIKITEKCGVASIGRAVTTLFLKSVCYTYILISLQPTRSLICILNEDEICLVRRAAVGQFNIKRIMINCSKYIHALREMIVHLTRQTSSALPMFTINTVYTEIIENEQ